MKLKLKAVGAYLYAGGFALGVNKSFDTVAAFQDDNYGAPTFEANFPGVPVYRNDWSMADGPEFDRIDFLYANPPCAIFSVAGMGPGGRVNDWRTDPRTDCWRKTLKLASSLEPIVFAIESVQQAATKGREFLQEITDVALAGGWSVTWLFVNAARMGVPQRRKRMFFVAHQPRIDWSTPTHREVTVREAFEAVSDPGRVVRRPAYDGWIPNIVAGVSAREWWEKTHPNPKLNALGQVAGRPPFTMRRLRWDRPSNTVFGDVMIHPGEDRLLGENETKALMGIPQDFKVVGSEFQKVLSRGVCPPVGAWLARNVRRAIETGVQQPAVFDRVDFS